MIPTKVPVEKLVLRALCYSTDLCFSHGQNTEGTACGPRTPRFSNSWSTSQALEPILNSQHLSGHHVLLSQWHKALNHDAWFSTCVRAMGALNVFLPPSTVGESM